MAAAEILEIPYKPRRSARHWQKLENVAEELMVYFRATGARSNVLPTRLELFASGFDELGNRLLTLYRKYTGVNPKKHQRNLKRQKLNAKGLCYV